MNRYVYHDNHFTCFSAFRSLYKQTINHAYWITCAPFSNEISTTLLHCTQSSYIYTVLQCNKKCTCSWGRYNQRFPGVLKSCHVIFLNYLSKYKDVSFICTHYLHINGLRPHNLYILRVHGKKLQTGSHSSQKPRCHTENPYCAVYYQRVEETT